MLMFRTKQAGVVWPVECLHGHMQTRLATCTYTSLFLNSFVRQYVNVRKYLIVRRVGLGPEKEKSITRVLSYYRISSFAEG